VRKKKHVKDGEEDSSALREKGGKHMLQRSNKKRPKEGAASSSPLDSQKGFRAARKSFGGEDVKRDVLI